MNGTPPKGLPENDPSAIPKASIAPGGIIGDIYRILGPLGSGGMGVVLLAEDTRLGRRVAVKLVNPKTRTERALDRLLDEARAMARVNHPNVVTIYAFGRHGGMPYFVMEYIQGETLSYWRRQQTFAPTIESAMPIFDQLCRGVEAIHRSGTIHGDIKPSNVLIDPSGRVAIADLGLSRTWSASPTGVPLRVVGTPAYMAPEKVRGKPIPEALLPRGDVYSLAILGYELLTGLLPFRAEDSIELMTKHLHDEPAVPSQVRPELTPAFDAPLLAALRKDPAERTPSAEELRHAMLEAFERVTRAPRGVSRILVVDDDESFLGFAEACLEDTFPGAKIWLSSDPVEALALSQRLAFDLAVIDLEMPSMNGIELTAGLRGSAAAADVPILVVTAHGRAADWRVLNAMGAGAFVLKPTTTSAFIDAAKKLARPITTRPIAL